LSKACIKRLEALAARLGRASGPAPVLTGLDAVTGPFYRLRRGTGGTPVKKIIQIGVTGSEYLSYKLLEPFQDELKQLDKTEYEKLRDWILNHKFSFAIHIWKHEGHNFIIDGHQRLFTVKQLVEVEGYECPDLPVVVVDADSFDEAKRKVIAGASSFGKVTQQGLFDFAVNNNISYEEIVQISSFHEIDMDKLGLKFLDIVSSPTFGDVPAALDSSMESSSAGVKQVNLLFTADTHAEFMAHCERLSKVFETENVTDTVMEVLRDCAK
jgi:hypothetical protein